MYYQKDWVKSAPSLAFVMFTSYNIVHIRPLLNIWLNRRGKWYSQLIFPCSMFGLILTIKKTNFCTTLLKTDLEQLGKCSETIPKDIAVESEFNTLFCVLSTDLFRPPCYRCLWPAAAVCALLRINLAWVRLYLSQQSSSGKHWRRGRSCHCWKGSASHLPGQRSGTGVSTHSPVDKFTTHVKICQLKDAHVHRWQSKNS